VTSPVANKVETELHTRCLQAGIGERADAVQPESGTPINPPLSSEDEQAALEADPDCGVCDRCGGDGMIEYNDGDGSDWGEDCPVELNHLITCRACQGTGKHR
jgi:hypothetical protein